MKSARGLTRRDRRRLMIGLLFASPWIIGFLWFTLFPAVASVYYSFTVYSLMGEPLKWVGLKHFADLLHDELFWRSLYNTMYMVVFGVLANSVAGVSLAMLLNTRLRGQSIYRTIFYLPTIVPTVATSILWLWVLNPQVGLINSCLRLVGIVGPAWIKSAELSKPSLIFMGLWGVGGAMVVYLAGLQSVPQHLYESAELDGAGPLRKIWNVTLPMISPVIFFNVIMGLIGGFQIFAEAYIMTDGGPLDSTLFYALYLYQNAFRFFKMGYAAAMAWVLLVITLLATLLVFRSSARFVFYEGERR